MKDLPEGYEVQLQSEYVFAEDLYTIYNYAFTGYSGDEFADIHVPEEVNSIEMNYAGWQNFYGDFYIPASIESAHFGWSGLQLYGKYIVDENNTKYSSNEDGLLMNKDQTIVYQTPIADAIYIPKGVTAIKGIVSWFVSDVYFDGPCMVDQSSFKNIQTDTIIHVPDEYYLDYFKKSYRRFVTNLINENGESYDYTVNNNLVFLNDERELVSTMDSAAGTIVIPETVEKIDDYAFSGNDKIICIIFTHGDVELGHQIFKDSHVEEVNFLTKDIPGTNSDTFSQADSLKAINVSINYYELYDDKWKNEIDQASFALLSETDSSFQTKNGFEYLEMYYRDRSHATILLNAPTNLIQFDENSIPGVTITEIGQHAFSECKNLKHVKLSKHINQIDSYAFYGCEALESIFSENTDSITIQENALEITDSWLFDLRYMAFNAKKAIFENDYLPSVTKQIYIPFDGEGYNGGNTYSGAYFIDESYGGEILYGYARGTDQNGNTVTVEDEFYLINATTDVQGDVATKDGKLIGFEQAFSNEEIKEMILSMCKDRILKIVEKHEDADFVYVNDLGRHRVNIYFQQGYMTAAIRIINEQIKTLEELNLPDVLHKLALLPRGLVLVTGPTGSGKSTTLAAMIDFISSMRNCHILTIEDPIEYVYQQKQALIHQREVYEDVDSFDTALKSAMREDPDVILVGEMRDYETIQAVITLAETGHLVFSTLHTIGAPKTIDRIIDVFPPHKQAQIRAQLASVLQAVVTQQLLPLASGKGRAAALEIMIANDAIKNLIRENKGHQIDTMIQTGRNEGMTTLNASLATLVNTGKVNRMVAERYSLDVGELRQLIR